MTDYNIYFRKLLAIEEFNKNDYMRKICKMTQLKNIRIFKDGHYLDQMFFCHILDHQRRDPSQWKNEEQVILGNQYRNSLKNL